MRGLGLDLPPSIATLERPRRIKLLRVSAVSLIAMLQAMQKLDRIVTIEGLPKDARVLYCDADPSTQDALVTLESEEFPELLPGCLIQQFSLTVSETLLPKAAES